MRIVSTTCIAIAAIGLMLAQPVQGQQYGKIPASQKAPSSMKYVPLMEQIKAEKQTSSFHYEAPKLNKSLVDEKVALVGIMRNAYTSRSRRTNQLGYDWKNGLISVIFRGGPEEEYPNAGNGSLVINTTIDQGASWSGTNSNDIFNLDIPGNIPGQELCARHPNIYAWDDNGTTRIAALWSNIFATFLNPAGVLGELAHKAGPYGGPYQGATLTKETTMQYSPSRMVSDKNGKLYSIFQSINPDMDEFTGDYFIMTSVDHGMTWNIDYTKPALSESKLPDSYQIFQEAVTFDVSPDGTILYIGFLGIYVEDGNFTFTDNRFGYVHSTDGGQNWTDPVMYPLYEWEFAQDVTLNTLDGWMLPSMAVAVDGYNNAHFLMSVNGQDTFYPLDSMLIGELTINPGDPIEPPTFYALAVNILPDFRRKINPRDATSGAQPTFSIWAEHEWSKSPDGMQLAAKWIDADSIFVVTPAGHTDAFVRDSTHDIFVLMMDLNNAGNGARGWEVLQSGAFDITNVTSSVGTDEKFTKISPIFNPENNELYYLYTIMAPGEFSPNEYYPDIDDIGPAELYFFPRKYEYSVVNSVEDPDVATVGFTLEQNYPNPFNPTTSIRFSLASTGYATLRVFNMLGEEVALAFQGRVEAGSTTVSFDASDLPSGQYMYRLESSGQTQTNIMTLMK
jgi:type IX secretion system substrate protein